MPQIRLTQKLVERAACPTGKLKHDLYDAGCKGLLLEVRPSGGKTWYLRSSGLRCRWRQMRIADARDLDLKSARRRAAELRGQIAMGQDPMAERDHLRSIPTFRAFIEERYVPYIQGYRRAWMSDIGYLHNHLLPRFGPRTLDQITKGDVIELHHGLKAAGYAPATANRIMMMLRHIFNRAIEWEVPGVTVNPTKHVRLFEENNLVERFLTPDEVRRLLASLNAVGRPELRSIVQMLLLSGARKREVLDATWDQFDLATRRWRIPISKSGKARHVPMSEMLVAVVAALPRIDGCPYLVPDPRTLRPFKNIHYDWARVRAHAGLADVRMHDLRHSFASFLVNSGRSIYEVQKILGHSQLRTTERYAHLSNRTLLDAANAAAASMPRDAFRFRDSGARPAEPLAFVSGSDDVETDLDA